MITMYTSDDVLGIGLAVLGVLIIITGLLFWSTTKPVPLEIEFVKDSYVYRLSYLELKALHMSGYAEFSLLMNILFEGFAIFVIIFGGLRLIWSGSHLHPFWDHLRPYLRSEHIMFRTKYEDELADLLAKPEEVDKGEVDKIKKELERKEEIIATQSSVLAELKEETDNLISEAEELKDSLKEKETQISVTLSEREELESRLGELEKDLKNKEKLSESMEESLDIKEKIISIQKELLVEYLDEKKALDEELKISKKESKEKDKT